MKLSLAQFDVARGKVSANLDRIQHYAAEASEEGADLLCLPEMCTTGFSWRRNRELLDRAADYLDTVAGFAKIYGLAICGSFLEKTSSGHPANSFHYFDANGSLRARYRKIHLFTLFQEDKHVEAGNDCQVVQTEKGIFGASICYDLRFPELFRRNTESGAVLHLLPAAFPHPRLAHWQTLVRARAIENQCFFVAINQCGIEGQSGSVGQTEYFGHSMVVDPWGEIVAEADASETLLSVNIDLSLVERVRSKLSAWEDRRSDLFGNHGRF